jgi:hypothetical protein
LFEIGQFWRPSTPKEGPRRITGFFGA